MWELSVHHLGVPYAIDRAGDPSDKHDIRRENLVALCWDCHRAADVSVFKEGKERKAQ
jgi:5-methylcytosine-specific restriction endonuclease McrA